ncbi:hypothetical protein GGI12_003930, partial [Dipsacomyces acuminosporus]
MTQLQPTTYIIIHDRTPAMRIMYVSSSIREALLYEPQDFIGRSPLESVADAVDKEEMEEHHAYGTEDNVIMTNCYVRSKDNQRVPIQSIVFACGNVSVGVVNTFPSNVATDNTSGNGILLIEGYKCVLNEGEQQQQRQQSTGNTLDTSAIYSMRATNQASIVVEELDPDDPDSDAGPKIVFATDSVNRILDVDSSDLQAVPFLSLVAMEDNQKAFELLDRALHSKDLVLQTLRLLENPFEESHLRSPKTVPV